MASHVLGAISHDIGASRRHSPVPKRRRRDDAGEDPSEHAREVPMPAQVVVSGQGDERGERLLFVVAGPESSLRELLLRHPEPLTARMAVIVPVELGICAEDLKTAASEEREKENVEEMGGPKPGREIERHVL